MFVLLGLGATSIFALKLLNFQGLSNFTIIVIGFLYVCLISCLFTASIWQGIAGYRKYQDYKKSRPQYTVPPEPEKNFSAMKEVLSRQLNEPNEFQELWNDYDWVRELLADFDMRHSTIKEFINIPNELLHHKDTKVMEYYASKLTYIYEEKSRIIQARQKWLRKFNNGIDQLEELELSADAIPVGWLKQIAHDSLSTAKSLLHEKLNPSAAAITLPCDPTWLNWQEDARQQYESLVDRIKWILDDDDGALSWYNGKTATEKEFAVFIGWPNYDLYISKELNRLDQEIKDFLDAKADLTNSDYWENLQELLSQQFDALFQIDRLMDKCHSNEVELLNTWYSLKLGIDKTNLEIEAQKSIVDDNDQSNIMDMQILKCDQFVRQICTEIGQAIITPNTNWQIIKYQLTGIMELLPDENLEDD